MLLARLQGKAVCGLALGIDGNPDQAAGHLAFQRVLAGHETRMRPAESERHAEALRGADADVRAELARRLEQGQRQQIRCADRHRPGCCRFREKSGEIIDATPGVRVLDNHREKPLGSRRIEAFPIAHDHPDPKRLAAGFHHVDRLRVAAVGNENRLAVGLAGEGERNRLGGRRALVEQRCVRDIQPGEIGHHRLEIEQRLQPSLRDLRLIRRVGGVPAGIFQDVPQDHARGDRPIVTLADETFQHRILIHPRLEPCQRLRLGKRLRQVHRAIHADSAGHSLGNQLVQGAVTHGFQHLGLFGWSRSDVAGQEGGCGGHECAHVMHQGCQPCNQGNAPKAGNTPSRRCPPPRSCRSPAPC